MEQFQKDQLIDEIAQNAVDNPPETDGQEQVVKGLAEAELTGRIQNSAETYNLALDIDPERLRSLGDAVFRGYDEDDKSRSKWLNDHTFWLSLYMQNDYAENSDQERDWGSTESVPVLTESCDQFQARTYKIFFPNDTFVSAVPMRKTVQDRKILEERAERIGKHMSYQLGFLDRSYKQDKDALFLGVAVHGSFFTKTYFNSRLRRFKVDNVRPTDLVINYHVGPIRIEDVRRKTHIIYTSVGETEDLVKDGFFIEAAIPAKTSTPANNEYNVKVDEIAGITPSDGDVYRNQQAVILEQHSYFDLDDSGNYLPYIITICAASRKVLRVSIGYEADMQGNPLDDYKQVQYFTHYKYAENPDGFYGLGLGHKIGDLTAAASIMLRQIIDAGTLANDGNMSGFISEKLGLESDEIRLVLGKMTKIPDTVMDMQQSIMMMQFAGPNQSLMATMQSIIEYAQRLGSVTEATTGSSDKNIQATTQLSMVEQALEMFSAVQMRIANSLSEELQKIYRINQRFLPMVEYFVVNGVPETITRMDYKEDMLIAPVFDPKNATQQQKIARATAELQGTLQNPVNQTRPQVIDEAFRRYFKAMEVEDIDALIPPQPEIQNIDDQVLENMFFLMPKEARPLFDVFPEQDHLRHLQLMEDLRAFEGVLQPDQLEDILKHQQKHTAYLYGQQKGAIPTIPSGTPPSMDGQGDAMGNGQTTGTIPPAAAELLSQLVGGPQNAGGPTTGFGVPQENL